MYIPDNYDAWKEHEAESEKMLERLPVCSWCGERVQDEYYYNINDEVVCEECLNSQCRRLTYDYSD